MKFIPALLVFFALACPALAQPDVSRSEWKTDKLNIDGNDKEWKKPFSFRDNASGFSYAIGNDSQNLYLVFSVNDPMKMMKLMRSGWSLELSSKEKKRKFKATLNIPGVQMTGNGRTGGGTESGSRAEGYLMIKAYEAQVGGISLSGFQSGPAELKLNGHSDIQLGIGAGSDQNLIYEIAIPFKQLVAGNLIQLNELITLNANVNVPTRPAAGGSEGRGPQGGGGMSGGGGGRQGGGMSGMGGGRQGGRMAQGGGHGGPGSGDRSAMPEKASFKQKFVLVGR